VQCVEPDAGALFNLLLFSLFFFARNFEIIFLKSYCLKSFFCFLDNDASSFIEPVSLALVDCGSGDVYCRVKPVSHSLFFISTRNFCSICPHTHRFVLENGRCV
jgi:hypothetical protein